MSDQEHKGAHGMLLIPFGVGTGAGTAGQWSLGDLTTIFSQTWAGSVLLFAVGAAGILACYGVPRATARLSLKIILIGLIADQILTLILVWPVRESIGTNLFGIWPYVLGTMATFLAGGIVGGLAERGPIRHACAVASLDFLFAGAIGFMAPYVLTWALVFRIAAGYCAVSLGAAIGRYARLEWKDPAVRREFFQKATIGCIAAVIGGFVTVLLKEYLSKLS